MDKKSQLQFAHRCSVLLEAGISLSEALGIIIRMETSKKRIHILKQLLEKVEKGVSLSKSILLSQARFEPMLVSMIEHGEFSGILAVSLRQVSEMMEKGSEIKKKIVGALIYPAFIALATIGMTLFLVMYIFPKIIPLFSSMNIKLPLLTRAVRELYVILVQFGIWGVLLFIAVSAIFFYSYSYKKHKVFRFRVQFILLVLPVMGRMLQKFFICISCRSTATLLDCGQPLPRILAQLGTSSSFEMYKKAWMFSKEEVERGISLSQSLRSFTTSFPVIVPDMISIGERTGSLSLMFHHISRMYEQELDDFIKQLSTSIEPVLMIFMGLIVGSVALSIILPIYEITNHLST